MTAGRLPCCVPFCRRTIGADKGYSEWVCPKHWRLVSRETRAAYALARRRARRIIARKPIYREYWRLPAGSPARLSAVAMWRRVDSVWERCKRQAIERALGGGEEP
ncbi:hypothetical protein [Methylosinus sp. LW4]|uniref:hypothetical protein n=1 Tax=Methylosinus sp. LW4 TaxID=136993 RepID=UPI000361EE16|nr:hypothetical protein [Methylosinus sp. LW4]